MTDDRLLSASLTLTGQLDLPEVLQDFVDLAAELTGARYGALAVLDNTGDTSLFVYHGISEELRQALGFSPHGDGLFAEIPVEGYLRLDDLSAHPAFTGFPKRHPKMGSFLGVPVRVQHQVFGRLYLSDKPGGFTDQDVTQVQQLAKAAAIAIANARAYAQSRARARWMEVSQEITTSLLEGADEEEVLTMIAQRVRTVADADCCLIVLPSVGDTWACEIVDGVLADQLLGIQFPPNGRALSVLRERVGVIVHSLQRAIPMRIPILRHFGAAMYAPMLAHGDGLGVIVVMRDVGRPEFEDSELMMAEGLAQQAALALELAAARHADDVANLFEERQRIARDLHDLAIQQLFATGMQIHSARNQLAEKGEDELAQAMENSLSSVDESVRQIRAIVQSLRTDDEDVVLVERLRRETSIGRTALGYAPSLIISVDGTILDDDSENPLVDEVESRVDADIADDLVAVVREGLSNAARHAKGNSVQVRVLLDGRGISGSVSVEVEDDGRGVDPEVTRSSGLSNLTARARRHGGDFSLTPGTNGRGTLMNWTAPLT